MQTPPIISRLRKFRGIVGITSGLVLLGLVAVIYGFDPARYSFYPRCVFYQTTGWYCPGCGATRGLHELVHGHFGAAVQMNAVIFGIGPVLGAGWLLLRRLQIRRATDSLTSFLTNPWGICAVVGFLLLFTTIRNLPRYPFTLLAPPKISKEF